MKRLSYVFMAFAACGTEPEPAPEPEPVIDYEAEQRRETASCCDCLADAACIDLPSAECFNRLMDGRSISGDGPCFDRYCSASCDILREI